MDAWSIRQTGVYQSFGWTTKTSFWLLLNPRKGSAADNRLKHLINARDDFTDFKQQSPLIGLVVLSTYFTNWRTLMAFYEQEELRMVAIGVGSPVSVTYTDYYQSEIVISAEIHERLQFSHSTLSQLRRLENRLMLLPSIFNSLIRTIDKLDGFADLLKTHQGTSLDAHRATKEILNNYKFMAEEYSQNAVFILGKIRTSAQLLLDTLNLKHQRIAQQVSENTLVLSNSAARDSSTIRVITIVTLLYLPATFVAVRASRMQCRSVNAHLGRLCSVCKFWLLTHLVRSYPQISSGYSLL